MPDQSSFDDTLVMQRIIKQDQIALAELYDQYSALVYSMAMRVLQNKVLAEEATQDTFMKVWKQADRWDADKGKLVTWLLTLTRYTAIDRLRKEKRQTPSTAIGFDDLVDMIGKSSVVNQTGWADREVFQQILKQLPQEQINVIELGFFKGMSHTEIANHLDLPLGTVKSRIRQGLITLKGLWIEAVQ